eukprot:COSAG05_NODE_453_length_9653_cov_21.886749_4_plen_101_part_00
MLFKERKIIAGASQTLECAAAGCVYWVSDHPCLRRDDECARVYAYACTYDMSRRIVVYILLLLCAAKCWHVPKLAGGNEHMAAARHHVVVLLAASCRAHD